MSASPQPCARCLCPPPLRSFRYNLTTLALPEEEREAQREAQRAQSKEQQKAQAEQEAAAAQGKDGKQEQGPEAVGAEKEDGATHPKD